MRTTARDSNLAFYINQLDLFDPRIHMPLYNTTWGRDFPLRPGISFINESASFTRNSFAAPGSQTADGLPWVSANGTVLPAVDVNSERIVQPIRMLARQVVYTDVELMRSTALGQPLDVARLEAMNIAYQMETDQIVYIGSETTGQTGFLNSSEVTVGAVPNGASGSPLWRNKTPDEILVDVNDALAAAWRASVYSVVPAKLLLPPDQYTYLVSQKVSNAGNMSILQFIMENSLTLQKNSQKLDIQPVKWLAERGVGGTNRMVVYTNDQQYLRFVMVPPQRKTVYIHGLQYIAPYQWAYGEPELIYPETLLYRDGI